MLLDASLAPLIFLRSGSLSETPLEDQLLHLLDQGRHFVLLTDHSPGDHDEHTPAERKEKALFFKKVKGRMQALCRGLIVLEGARPASLPSRLAATAASKALGIAVEFAPNEEIALHMGRALIRAHELRESRAR